MNSVAIISSASASCGTVMATRTAPMAAMKKAVRPLPRDPPAVTTSSPAGATSSAFPRAITATWSATVWMAAMSSDAVSINENFIASLFYRWSQINLTINR